LAIGGVSSPLDSFVVSESSVLRTNFCAEKPANRQSAKRYKQPKHSAQWTQQNDDRQKANALPTHILAISHFSNAKCKRKKCKIAKIFQSHTPAATSTGQCKL